MNKSAIIAVTQGDFLYIKDWIEYHHNIGFDFILIGYNGSTDNMNDLPKYDYVRYIDFSFDKNNKYTEEFNRYFKGFSAIEFFKPKCELNFMCRCLCILLDYIKFFYQDIQYVACIDTDEYIIVSNNNINKFLSENFDQSLSSMQMDCKIMTDNNLIYYEDRPVLERFTEYANKHHWSSDIVKYYNYKSIINVYHYNIQRDIQIISSPHNISLAKKAVFNNSQCFIKHFYTKSLEEYLMKFDPKYDNDYMNRFGNRMLYNYFMYNKYYPEKFYAWNELCKKYNIKFDIYHQIEPGPFFKCIKKYCELFNIDYNIIIKNYQENKLNGNNGIY